jgi:hypothetical protein
MESALILVFYLYPEVIQDIDIRNQYINAITSELDRLGIKAMCLFFRTETEERVECINPRLAEPEEMGKINSLISQLKDKFDIDPIIED